MSDQSVKASRELDAMVAEKVMGNSHWIREAPDPSCEAAGACDGFGPAGECSQCTGVIEVAAPHYSSSIADGFAVVEAMREKGYRCSLEMALDRKTWWACFWRVVGQPHQADTLPLAICLASLKALEAQG